MKILKINLTEELKATVLIEIITKFPRLAKCCGNIPQSSDRWRICPSAPQPALQEAITDGVGQCHVVVMGSGEAREFPLKLVTQVASYAVRALKQ